MSLSFIRSLLAPLRSTPSQNQIFIDPKTKSTSTICRSVELWVISILEISHAFPLIVVDINELAYL